MTTQPESPEPLKVVAWGTTRTLDGKEILSEMCISTNPAYVKVHNHHAWEPLVLKSDAEAAIQAARNEAEAMRADARRLDWLDSLNQRLNAHYQTTYQWKLVLSPNVVRLMSGRFDIDLHDSEAKGVPSCRTAIDAAMKGDDQ